MAIIMQDNFAGTTIDTAKWNETDADGIISQNNELIINVGTHSSKALFANKLQSDSTITSGVAVLQARFDFTSEPADGNGAMWHLMLYVDDSNWAAITCRSGSGDALDDFRLQITDGGSVVYDNYATAVSSPDDVKITYNIATGAIAFYYWTTEWVQLGTTQTFDIGSTVYACLTCRDLATWSGTNIGEYDNLFFTQTDYSTQYPADEVISVGTNSRMTLLGVGL
jgi:hypothetical protein